LVSSLRSARLRYWSVTALVAVIAALATSAMSSNGFVGAQPAHATEGYFCSNKSLAAGSRGRCSFPQVLLSQVWSWSIDGTGIAHCAIGKQNDDGSGGNSIEPSCGPARTQATACVGGAYGYPYIINQSSATHNFDGRVGYNGECVP
jgi:hypothetical protein